MQLVHISCTRYRWALIVGPKTETMTGRGIRYHAKEKVLGAGSTRWIYEDVEIPLMATNMLLVCITIAKIQNLEWVCEILQAVPMKPDEDGWNCVV